MAAAFTHFLEDSHLASTGLRSWPHSRNPQGEKMTTYVEKLAREMGTTPQELVRSLFDRYGNVTDVRKHLHLSRTAFFYTMRCLGLKTRLTCVSDETIGDSPYAEQAGPRRQLFERAKANGAAMLADSPARR